MAIPFVSANVLASVNRYDNTLALNFFWKIIAIMTAQLTKPIYYYDNNGYKIGPVRKRDIIALAGNGTINPETRITDDKIEIKAKQIPNLKFFAPEYHQAEELFNPENIDFDNIPLASNQEPIDEQTQETNIPVPINTVQTKDTTPFLQFSTTRSQETNPQKTNYWYFNLVVKTFYPIATCIFYGGLTLTGLATLTCLIISIFVPIVLLLALSIFLGGTVIFIFYAFFLGLIADHIQWQINIEKHLKEIKNRSNQND